MVILLILMSGADIESDGGCMFGEYVTCRDRSKSLGGCAKQYCFVNVNEGSSVVREKLKVEWFIPTLSDGRIHAFADKHVIQAFLAMCIRGGRRIFIWW